MPALARITKGTSIMFQGGRPTDENAKAGLIFTTCALALNALIGARGLPAVLDARRDYRALAADLDRIRHENAQLRQEVGRLRDDPQTIEEIARRDLHFMRPGEKLFLLRTAEPPDARTPR